MRGANVRHVGPVQQQTSDADHQRGKADQAVPAKTPACSSSSPIAAVAPQTRRNEEAGCSSIGLANPLKLSRSFGLQRPWVRSAWLVLGFVWFGHARVRLVFRRARVRLDAVLRTPPAALTCPRSD
jgi:hypothetical protein